MPASPSQFRLPVLCLFLALAGFVWLRPDLLAVWGLDLAEFAEWQEKAARAAQHREAQDHRKRITLQRIKAKEDVVGELLNGRLSLLQAARRFKDLNETPITCQDDYRSHYPGQSDGEKACRQVLDWLLFAQTEYPRDQQEALLHRFEDELREHLQRNGGIVVLPE